MRSLGGYLELELGRGEAYHASLVGLNTGRNALEYILRANGYKKVYLPGYTCVAVLEPILRAGLDHAFYSIDQDLRPQVDVRTVEEDAAFLYTNYFGVCDAHVAGLAKQCGRLIVDNAQAFYAKPPEGVDAFYSARKFFGVPDGGYASTRARLDAPLEDDISYTRCTHLLQRHDLGPEKGYAAYQEAEVALDGLPMRSMSRLTQALMSSIDYAGVADRRRINYALLHAALGGSNRLRLPALGDAVPMAYPFWTSEPGLRQHLVEARIYTAQYWPNVSETAPVGSIDMDLATNLIALPVDQRLTKEDVQRIVELVDTGR
jgi:dTDP-4-amino-4,6-dideoxygalactose transaminase